MTIYVCQELEQNQLPLPQKQDDNGDNSLCGEWNRASHLTLSLLIVRSQCFSYFSHFCDKIPDTCDS